MPYSYTKSILYYTDIRSRLGPNPRSSEMSRNDKGSLRQDQVQMGSIKDRLGARSSNGQGQRPSNGPSHESDVLDRDQLESRRPNTKPWEVNPEYVPRGRGYYEVIITMNIHTS